MAKILLIDDQEDIHVFLSEFIEEMGHELTSSYTLEEGLYYSRTGNFDVVLLDLKLPDGNGLAVLPRILDAPSKPEVIILTGTGGREGAKLAFQHGAWDFLQKPFMRADLTFSLSRAVQYRNEKNTPQILKVLNREGIIGSSRQLKGCLELVAQAAMGDVNVLITGETGTGKELFARAVHDNSERAKKSFVVVDCTVLPEPLVESTLFGHKKGSFTGAEKAHEGLVKSADGGTLFLDEVGELPLSTQKSFLRVLQEKRFRPVGGGQEITSNFRLIAATNRNLDRMVEKNQFRRDLLFRLRSLNIHLPPLRERSGDIRELIHHYLARLTQGDDQSQKGFSPEFLEALQNFKWPGNVRELKNSLERAIIAAGADPILYPKHLTSNIRLQLIREPESPEPHDAATASEALRNLEELPSFRDYRASALAKAEEEYLRNLVIRVKGSRDEASRLSGLSGARLYALLKQYGIPRFK